MNFNDSTLQTVPGNAPCGWILLGSPRDAASLLRDAAKQRSTYWTSHKCAKIGDYAFFYITNPVKAIIVSGRISTEPVLQDNPRKSWYKKYFSEVSELREFPQIVTIRELKHLYPEWIYWRQPRSNC